MQFNIFILKTFGESRIALQLKDRFEIHLFTEHVKPAGAFRRRRGARTTTRGDARRRDGASGTSLKVGGYHAWSRTHLTCHRRSSETQAMGTEMHLSRFSPRSRLRRCLAGEPADSRLGKRDISYRR